MSFSVIHAGPQPDVAAKLAADPHPNFQYGGELGALTRKYLADVVALAGEARTTIVEANGHADGGQAHGNVSLTIRVLTTAG